MLLQSRAQSGDCASVAFRSVNNITTDEIPSTNIISRIEKNHLISARSPIAFTSDTTPFAEESILEKMFILDLQNHGKSFL